MSKKKKKLNVNVSKSFLDDRSMFSNIRIRFSLNESQSINILMQSVFKSPLFKVKKNIIIKKKN